MRKFARACRAHLLFLAFIVLLPAALAVCVGAVSAQTPADPLVVRTTAGLVRGIARPGGGAEFLGIPYAQPPLGDLRWREPLPAKPWADVRNAIKFGASCSQAVLEGAWNKDDATEGQEDCLFLNVVAPEWPVAKPLPVMFWIHGGANHGGSGSGDLYNSGTLQSHGVLIVTINYRLGVFGFLAHPALTAESPHHSSGDYGLMDQILALHWVHENIANFGGDPNNVTVFGQSAGSMDIGMLLTSPLAAGLFEKAIGESGAGFAPAAFPLAQAEKFGLDAAAALSMPAGAEGIAALRKISAHNLLVKLGDRNSIWPGFGPDVDGWVIPHSPADVFAAGNEAAVPLLLGTTSREFGSSEPLDALRATITRAYGDFAPQALALYGLAGKGQGANDALYGPAASQWSADIVFHCPIGTEALWHRDAGHPTFEYEFDRPIPGKEAEGSVHSAELPYVFGFYPKSGDIGGKFGPVDRHLADMMETYWTNFAKTGDPNGADLPHWPPLDETQSFLRFTVDGKAEAVTSPLRGAQCELYRKVQAEKIKLEP